MKESRNPHKEFEKIFSKKHAGYVLITCGIPSEDGNMQVEMTYGGSPALANILINGAQEVLEEEHLEESFEGEESSATIRLVKS